MKRLLSIPLLAAGLVLLGASAALAWNLDGYVYCEGTGLPLSGVTIQVVSTDGQGFSDSAVSDDGGYYFVGLPNVPGAFHATALVGASESIVVPASGGFDFATTDVDFIFHENWVIASPSCANEGCWLTGGGAKFSAITDTYLGQAQIKRHNWGGNVNPGCSPTAGDGGNWNDIDAQQQLHFQGQHIEVIRCGNVDGIPPGSTSPETPFNFIEFQGTGRLQGIKGNKVDFGTVYFFGRCEDRNEPGSNGQRDGSGKDRYFLNVFTNQADPVGSSVMLIDEDGDPATVDPLIITDGNLQIHVSSCDTPPTNLTLTRMSQTASEPAASTIDVPAELMLAATPNPALDHADITFALPVATQGSLRIFDVAGRQVSTLAEGTLTAGRHAVTWNLTDRTGSPVRGGVYFLRLSADGVSRTRAISVAR